MKEALKVKKIIADNGGISNSFLQIWKYIHGSLLVMKTDKETKMEVKAKLPKEPQNGPSSVCKHRSEKDKIK